MMYTICFSFKKHGIVSFLRRIEQHYNAVVFIHGNNYLKYILSHCFFKGISYSYSILIFLSVCVLCATFKYLLHNCIFISFIFKV